MENTPPVTVDVKGADRFRYFRRPLVQMPSSTVPPKGMQYQLLGTDFKEPQKVAGSKTSQSSKDMRQFRFAQTRAAQTDFRESEAQTIPWAPPYVVTESGVPEILTLANLAWEHGLPAGTHEVEIIERARMKRAWEKIMPPMDTPENIEKRIKCIADIEKDEWLFREEEIQTIHNLRMEVAEQIMNEKKVFQKQRLKDKMARVVEKKDLELKNKIKRIRQKKERELRKLYMKHKGITDKKEKGSPSEEISDPTSLIHGPMTRFGERNINRHEDIIYDKELVADYEGITYLENVKLPAKPAFNYVKLSKPKVYYQMCPRATRWTEESMEKLQEDLKKIHLGVEHCQKPNLIERLPEKIPETEVLSVKIPHPAELEIYQAATYLQKVIRGRAVQCSMYEDRNKFKYLIKELRSTHALEEEDMNRFTELRYNFLKSTRLNQVARDMEEKKRELISLFSGEVTSEMLDFLAKEQERIEDEQRVHAFAMLAERERWRREAAESGRRQREDIFRQKMDDAFKKIMQVRQETVEIYLQDVIIKSMNWLSQENAREYVKKVAKKIDNIIYDYDTRNNSIVKEEMTIELLHSFLVPETYKELIRRRIREKQKRFLSLAHQEVYKKLLTSNPETALEDIVEDVPIPEIETYLSEVNAADGDSSEFYEKVNLELPIMKTECIPKTMEEEKAYFERMAKDTEPKQASSLPISSKIPKALTQLADLSMAITDNIEKKAVEIAEKQPKTFVERMVAASLKTIQTGSSKRVEEVVKETQKRLETEETARDLIDSVTSEAIHKFFCCKAKEEISKM